MAKVIAGLPERSRPASFASLQRRLGRKSVGARPRRQSHGFVAYTC